jgi:hypothetical protein
MSDVVLSAGVLLPEGSLKILCLQLVAHYGAVPEL